MPSVDHPGRSAAWLAKQVELALAAIDLTLPQFRVLSLLAQGADRPSRLAARLDVRRPTVTAVVDGLEARGLVARTAGDEDRRRVTHSLTPAGRRLLEAADQAADARLGAVAASLGGAEAARALDGLSWWGSAMAAYHAGSAVSAR